MNHWILHTRISLPVKFHFEQTVFSFWTKIAQKGYFQSKTEEMNIVTKYCIFKLVYVPNFSLGQQVWFARIYLAENGISGLKQKNMKNTTLYRISD